MQMALPVHAPPGDRHTIELDVIDSAERYGLHLYTAAPRLPGWPERADQIVGR